MAAEYLCKFLSIEMSSPENNYGDFKFSVTAQFCGPSCRWMMMIGVLRQLLCTR